MSRIRNKAHEFLAAYEHMNSVMEKRFGYNLYFIGGTLLGYVRENDFLEHDRDMDVSYFSKYDNVADVRKELLDIIGTLIETGEKLHFIRHSYSLVTTYLRWSIDERDRIDVMPTWCQDGMIYRPTFVAYKGNSDVILPLKKEKFYGHDIYIPNRPEIKLANVYGETWRIPDRGFNKRKRRNEYTARVISRGLAFPKEAWQLVKQTQQWKDLSFFEKLFMRMLRLRKYRFFAVIIPERNVFRNRFFKWIRSWITKSGRIYRNN